MDAKLSHKSTRALPLCMASANATKLHSTVVDAQFRECMALKVVSTMVDISHAALTGRPAASTTSSKERCLTTEEPKGNG